MSLSPESVHTLGSIMLSVQCLQNVCGVDQINSSAAFISKQSYGLVYPQTSCAVSLCFPLTKVNANFSGIQAIYSALFSTYTNLFRKSPSEFIHVDPTALYGLVEAKCAHI